MTLIIFLIVIMIILCLILWYAIWDYRNYRYSMAMPLIIFGIMGIIMDSVLLILIAIEGAK